MTEKTDPLAENHARNALTELLWQTSSDIADADTHAGAIIDTHIVTWERQVMTDPAIGGVPLGRDVYVRRYVLRGEWEVDPEGKAYFDAAEKRLTDMLAARGTVAAEEAEMNTYVDARRGGMTDVLTDLIEAFRGGGQAAFHSPEATVREVASRRGVTL